MASKQLGASPGVAARNVTRRATSRARKKTLWRVPGHALRRAGASCQCGRTAQRSERTGDTLEFTTTYNLDYQKVPTDAASPAWMTSDLRELVCVPMALSDLRTSTSRPSCAKARAMARPTTPAGAPHSDLCVQRRLPKRPVIELVARECQLPVCSSESAAGPSAKAGSYSPSARGSLCASERRAWTPCRPLASRDGT